MRAEIDKSLAEVEGEKQVKIFYACESGSRAWGFPSADSDYDVRFIYVAYTIICIWPKVITAII